MFLSFLNQTFSASEKHFKLAFSNKIDNFFLKFIPSDARDSYHLFLSKKRNVSLRQAKTGKYECYRITTLLLYLCVTRGYTFSLEEMSCYDFFSRNSCCKSLASDGIYSQSGHQSYFKTPIYGASLLN